MTATRGPGRLREGALDGLPLVIPPALRVSAVARRHPLGYG